MAESDEAIKKILAAERKSDATVASFHIRIPEQVLQESDKLGELLQKQVNNHRSHRGTRHLISAD